jgi:hypothetical protein
MEVKFDIGGKSGQQVNVQAEYQLDDVISLGVRVNGDNCLTGKVEYNNPSLFTLEVNGGIEEGEWQFPYNVGVSRDPQEILGARFTVGEYFRG